MFSVKLSNGFAGVAAICLCLAGSAVATAQEVPAAEPEAVEVAPSLDKRVDTLLSGIETTPSPEQWLALGEEAVGVLAAILNDETQPVVRRGRAAIGLSHFRTAGSSAALRTVLIDARTPKHVRRKSIVALARVDGEQSLDLLQHELTHRSNRVREEAIRAIGDLATPRAQQVLRARLKNEKSKYLLGIITDELAKTPSIRVTGEVPPIKSAEGPQ